MASSSSLSSSASSSAHLECIHYIPQSLKQVQLLWFVSQQQGEVGGQPKVQISIIDHTDGPREWMCQRATHENAEDFYDLPSHLLVPGHRYEINIKLMSRDNSSADVDDDSNGLMQVHHTATLNFRLSEYALRGLYANYMQAVKIICKAE